MNKFVIISFINKEDIISHCNKLQYQYGSEVERHEVLLAHHHQQWALLQNTPCAIGSECHYFGLRLHATIVGLYVEVQNRDQLYVKLCGDANKAKERCMKRLALLEKESKEIQKGLLDLSCGRAGTLPANMFFTYPA